MNNSFNSWSNISNLPIDDVADYILTGKTVADFYPDEWLYKHIGDKTLPLSVLDFGCGIGRNTFGLGFYAPKWTVIGYDNPGMIGLTKEYFIMKYNRYNRLANVSFSENWSSLSGQCFDAIFCCIVLQHIYEQDLASYIQDFKKMTKRLIVFGRRFNDGRAQKSNWTILEENGLVPLEFYAGNHKTEYSPEGDINEHNTAIYIL